MITVAIVDDNKSETEALTSFLKQYGDECGEKLEITAFKSGFDFLDGYKAVYDVVFMDIEMPEMDGMSAARRLRQFDGDIAIIFVTNIAKYAIAGYEVGALDYFLKPPRYPDIKLRMEIIRKRKQLNDYSVIIPFQGGVKRLSVREIVYVESRAHLITFHTETDEFVYRGATLKQLENELTAHGFYRCNSCYIVNLRYCTGITDNMVTVNGEELQISRARKTGFVQALMRALGG